jgi:hypothetical protein
VTIADPAGLWLLAAAIPLTALYLYRTRPRLLRVPHLALWDETIAEERRWGGARLRELVSLATLLGAIAALALALAGAEIPAWAHRPRAYTVLLDTSASMRTIEPDGRSRATAAQAFLKELAARLYYNDTLTLRPSPGDHFAPFAASAAAHPPGGELLVLSDRSEPAPEIPGARWVRIASERPNVGFTHAAASRAPEERWTTVRVRARNFGRVAATVRVDWRLDGASRRADPVALEPGGERELAMTFEGAPDGGELWVVLTPSDAYAPDDDARLRLPPARPLAVGVFHEGRANPFLMEALAILAEEDEIDPKLSFVEPAARFASIKVPPSTVAIFDGGTLETPPPAGRYLWIGTAGAGLPLRVGAPIAAPPVVTWNPASPVNRFLDLSSLHLRAARPIEANGDAQTLVETEQAPIGCLRRDADGALVYLGFRLDESDFVLSPSFPIFLRNALRWLTEPPIEPARFDPIESDNAPKAPAEDPAALLPPPPVAWRNVPHAVLLAILGALLLAIELVARLRARS